MGAGTVVTGTDGLAALLDGVVFTLVRTLIESGLDVTVLGAIAEVVTVVFGSATLVEAAADGAELVGIAGRGFLGMATEYMSSKFFFFNSETISERSPSELLVVVLPVSSRFKSGSFVGSCNSSMLAYMASPFTLEQSS